MPRRTPWRFARSFAKWACTVAAVTALGIQFGSHWYGLTWIRSTRPRSVWLVIHRGWGYLELTDVPRLPVPNGLEIGVVSGHPSPQERAQPYPRALSLHWRYVRASGPLWIPALAFALPAAFFWWRDAPAFRRRRAMRRNECPSCGYSLAGLSRGNECPECGATPPAR